VFPPYFTVFGPGHGIELLLPKTLFSYAYSFSLVSCRNTLAFSISSSTVV
jgi:hypothetical protein